MDPFFSDVDSFSESSSSDDQDDVEFLYGGHACSLLSSLDETLGKIDDFLSFERGFIHGDIVCSVNDPSGQLGKVINVDIIVDLENIHGSKIQDVNTKHLKRIRTLSVGDYVVNGAWLGKVEKIIDRVTVLLDDGTKSDFTTSGPEKLIPTSPDLLEDSQYPFYPGQRVQVNPSSASKSLSWFCGIKKDIGNQGTVCSVDAGLVYVDWIGCAVVGCGKLSTPPCLQDSKNLSLLSCFSHANWQLGDWCLLPVLDSKSDKGQNFFTAPACGLVKGKVQSERVCQRGNFSENFQQIAVIVKTKTKVNVLWQDGSHSKEVDSHSLIPVNVTDAHDFWPGQFVLEKETCDDSPLPSIQRWGIVKCVDAKERTVKVKWSTFSVDQSTNIKLKQVEEILSAYELVEHPDYSYSLGDAVFRLQSCHFCNKCDEKASRNHLIAKSSMGTETDLKCTDNYKDLKEYSDNNLLSCIGIIVGLKDEDVEVKWASGATNKVAPYEIYQVEKCEGLSPTIAPYTGNTEQQHEATTELNNQFSGQREKDKSGFDGCSEDTQTKSWDSSSCSFPQAAIGLFTSISSSLFGSLSSSLFGTYKHLSKDGENHSEEVLELCNMYSGDIPTKTDSKTIRESNSRQKVKEAVQDKDPTPASGSKHFELFKRFDMVSDCSDHHFNDGVGKGLQFSQIKRSWLKKVQQEWSILEKNLPETIYVRAYEERMDLLRAALLGAPGTPYHDGLFVFDIFLPPEYPQEPPMVYYNSGGLRVNPNLYESGKVCLSLLNTWTGSGSEVWNPENSTILQVLLSLQALVLNEKPYFNEAGYDSQMGKAEGEKNSVSYNENAFVVSCKSMLYLLRKPPMHFEALIEEHVKLRSKHILLACKAYIRGAPVGSAFGNNKVEQDTKNRSSLGFKIMLGKLFPKLVEAFTGKGMDCSYLLDEPE